MLEIAYRKSLFFGLVLKSFHFNDGHFFLFCNFSENYHQWSPAFLPLPDTCLLSFIHWSTFFLAVSHYLITFELKNKCSSHYYFCDLTDQLAHLGYFWVTFLWLLIVVHTLPFTVPCFLPCTVLSVLAGNDEKTKKAMCSIPEEVVPMKTAICYSFSLSQYLSVIFLSSFISFSHELEGWLLFFIMNLFFFNVFWDSVSSL